MSFTATVHASPNVQPATLDALAHMLELAASHSLATNPRRRNGPWSHAEDAFLAKSLGWLTDAEIGLELGRSEIAVHLRWSRDLGLPSPSKAPDVITANLAADLIGIDAHKLSHWVDVGLIPGRRMPGTRNIRLIQRDALRRWVLNPENWIYINPRKIADRELRRMAMKRMARWGDEWWTTAQVAEYHGVDTSDVKRYIKLGRISARQTDVSLGGRHASMSWASWFVLRSEATRAGLVFARRGKGSPGVQRSFTPRADAWILKARDELGMTFRGIERTMKISRQKCGAVISARYYRLKEQQKRRRK